MCGGVLSLYPGYLSGRCGLGTGAKRGGEGNCGAASASSLQAVLCRNATVAGGFFVRDSPTTWGQLGS
eukprot:1553392-Prorocentrum_lima.AAC.1